MKSPSSKFYRDFILVIIFCAAGAYTIAKFGLQVDVPISFWLSTALLSAITLFVHRILVRANSKRPQAFVTYFMGTLTGKLLLSVIILFVVGVVDPDHLKFTAIGFFVVYALLTTVELLHLLRLVRNTDP